MIKNPRLTKIEPKLGVIGFFSCTYHDIQLNSIAVKQKENGEIYLMCPCKIYKNQKKQYFHPVTSELYQKLLEAVKSLI